jgi:hypothetical protein
MMETLGSLMYYLFLYGVALLIWIVIPIQLFQTGWDMITDKEERDASRVALAVVCFLVAAALPAALILHPELWDMYNDLFTDLAGPKPDLF